MQPKGTALAGWQARILALLLLCALASCGGQTRVVSSGAGAAYPHYDAPGPPDDPWGPYIREASGRFTVPERWVREVMRQESGGHQYLHGQPITSDAGAAGLMQLMPATYEELRGRYGLGGDPYDPHDNIMAGTAYIGELYNSYGSPAFLAAYNAGPHRLETYMAGKGGLPNQTVDYLASIAPRLGNERPLSGPLAAYADSGQAIEVAQARPEPGEPAPAPMLRPPSAYVPHAYARPPRPGCWEDPDAAYDPDAPCRPAPPEPHPDAAPPAPVQPAQAVPSYWASRLAIAPQPQPDAPTPAAGMQPGRFALISSAAASPLHPGMGGGSWAVQIGAFSTPDRARAAAETSRADVRILLASTRVVLSPTSPFGGQRLYRARLLGLTAKSAADVCGLLSAQRQACVAVPPGQ